MAERIEKHLDAAIHIAEQIEESDHPLAGEIIDALEDEGLLVSTDVVGICRRVLDI